MMKIAPVILMSGVLLSGCDNSALNTGHRAGIQVAALPLIQAAIARQVPLFDGRWNANIMGRICQLADGELDKQGFTDWFIRRGVDVNALAARDSGFASVAKIDVGSAQSMCAAWLVSSQLAPVEAWGSAVDSVEALNLKMAPLTPLIDQTVTLLAGIAYRTTQDTYSTEQDYRAAVSRAFIKAAPAYIKATLNGHFLPENYRRPGSQSSIYTWRMNHGQAEVYFNGVTWLGAGKVKGEFYTVSLKDLAAQP